MNEVLAEIYSTIIPSAPYIIVAYVAVWLALCVFLGIMMHRLNRAEKEVAVLEHHVNTLLEKKGEE